MHNTNFPELSRGYISLIIHKENVKQNLELAQFAPKITLHIRYTCWTETNLNKYFW